MAIAADQASLAVGNATGSASCAITTTATVSSGGFIVVLSGAFTPNSINIPSGGGLTWAQAGTLFASSNIKIGLFYAQAPGGLASGTVITSTLSSGVGDWLEGAMSFVGVDASAPIVAFNGGSASTAAWSSGSVAANAGDTIVGGCFTDGMVGTSTPTSPAIEWLDHNNAGQNETQTGVYKLNVSGSESIAGTWSSAIAHAAIGVALKPSPTGDAVQFGPVRVPLRTNRGR